MKSYLKINVNFAKDFMFALSSNVYRKNLIADLFKAFNCLHHVLLIAKLDVYAFDMNR